MKRMHWQRGNTLLGVFIGLVIGVLISFGVVWMMNKTPLPFRDHGARTDRPGNGDEPSTTPAPLPGNHAGWTVRLFEDQPLKDRAPTPG